MPLHKKQLPGTISKPRMFFRAAERGAVEIRKLLCDLNHRGHASSRPGYMDDAVDLAQLIEQLARSGRDLPAANAFDLAEIVEIYIDELERQIDALLAS